MRIIKNNLLSIDLELCPQKTVLIHFSRKKQSPNNTVIIINNVRVQASFSTKFLCIICDLQLTFTPHINYVISKCNQALNIIKFLCGTWWGSDPNTLIILYKTTVSYIRSLIDYGCFIYYPSRKNTCQKLEKIQYTAITIAFGYRISTPTNVILAESKLTTIYDRTHFLCQKFIIKACLNYSLTTFENIHQFHRKIKNKRKRKRIIQKCIEESLHQKNELLKINTTTTTQLTTTHS